MGAVTQVKCQIRSKYDAEIYFRCINMLMRY